jgi:hypothetical protein
MIGRAIHPDLPSVGALGTKLSKADNKAINASCSKLLIPSMAVLVTFCIVLPASFVVLPIVLPTFCVALLIVLPAFCAVLLIVFPAFCAVLPIVLLIESPNPLFWFLTCPDCISSEVGTK